MTYLGINGAAVTQAGSDTAWPPAGTTIPAAVDDYCFIFLMGTSTWMSASPWIFSDSGKTTGAGFSQVGSTGGSGTTIVKCFRKKLVSGDITAGNLKTLYSSGLGGSAGRIMGVVLHSPFGWDTDPVVETFIHTTQAAAPLDVATPLTNNNRPQAVLTALLLATGLNTPTFTWDGARQDINGSGGVTVSAASGASTINDSAILATDVGQPVTNSAAFIPAGTLIGSVIPGVSFTIVNAAGSPVTTTGSISNVNIGGVKRDHSPYFDRNAGTTSDGGGTWAANVPGTDGHHFGTNNNIFWGDFWLYSEADYPKKVTQTAGTNATHVTFTVNIQGAATPSGEIDGKGATVNSAKGTLQPDNIYFDGKGSIVSSGKATLNPNGTELDGKGAIVMSALAPSGMASVVIGPSPIELSGHGDLCISAKGDLYTPPVPYLLGKMSIVSQAKASIDYNIPIPIGQEPNLVWDKVGERFYETGIDRGVLYLLDGRAVVWNGLTEVTEKVGNSTSPLYFDGMKIGEDITLGDFEATLKAFTYPDEFYEVQGFASLRHGILLGDQRPEAFNLSYRTKIGNDENQDRGYKIHILYNVIAMPNDNTVKTLSESVSLEEFEWDLTATPEEIDGFSPTAHIVLNSLDVDSYLLENLESLLWGNGNNPPSLPTLQDLITLIEGWYRVEIIDHGDGTWSAVSSIPGMITMTSPTQFSIISDGVTIIDSDTYQITSA